MRNVKGAGGWRRAAGLLAPLLLLCLSACGKAPGAGADEASPPNPLLYEIAAADGTVEGWMFGTIHALPDGTDWRTSEIGRVIDAADLLVVEIAGLDRNTELATTFRALATSPGLPPINSRVPAELAAPLAGLLERGRIAPEDLTTSETWAAAITLARVDATGDPANGIDRALIDAFEGRPVRELEGIKGQLSIFDRLPEYQQRSMLAAVVRESETARADPERLQRAWLAGDSAAIQASTLEGFLADPDLREALLTGRNRRWMAALSPLIAQRPRPLIAVGTAHLVGPDGLAALLEAQGYRVRRLS